MQIDTILLKEEMGFRQNRNCCEKILSIVTHVENGFQKKKIEISIPRFDLWIRHGLET